MEFNYKCEVCGKNFNTKFHHSKYCSNECRKIHYNERYIYKMSWEPKKIRCKCCNISFLQTSWNQLYCSKKCGNQYSKERYKNLREGIVTKGNGKKENYLALRFRVFQRDNFICQYCGRNVKDDGIRLHADHIIPKSKGGKDTFDNFTTSCSDCNLGKHDTLLSLRNEEYIKKRVKSSQIGLKQELGGIQNE